MTDHLYVRIYPYMHTHGTCSPRPVLFVMRRFNDCPQPSPVWNRKCVYYLDSC